MFWEIPVPNPCRFVKWPTCFILQLQIVNEKKLYQINDGDELKKLCEDVIKELEKAVRDYKSGKTKAFKALLGAVVSKSNNRANMRKCAGILKDMLDNK